MIAEISKVEGLYCDFISGVLTILIQDTFSGPASEDVMIPDAPEADTENLVRFFLHPLNRQKAGNNNCEARHMGELSSHLIANLLTFHTPVTITRALQQLLQEDHAADTAALATLSP